MKLIKKMAIVLASVALCCGVFVGVGCDNVVNEGTVVKYEEWCQWNSSCDLYEYDQYRGKWTDSGSAEQDSVFTEMNTYSCVFGEVKGSYLKEENILVGVSLIVVTDEDAEIPFAFTVFEKGEIKILEQKFVSTTANEPTVVSFEFDRPITELVNDNNVFRVYNREFVQYIEEEEIPNKDCQTEEMAGGQKYYYDVANGGYASIKWRLDEWNLVIEDAD